MRRGNTESGVRVGANGREINGEPAGTVGLDQGRAVYGGQQELEEVWSQFTKSPGGQAKESGL